MAFVLLYKIVGASWQWVSPVIANEIIPNSKDVTLCIFHPIIDSAYTEKFLGLYSENSHEYMVS